MKKINIYISLLAILLLAGCDYNEEHFSGYDSNLVKDVIAYTGEYTGEYPDAGYFTDRTSLTTAVDKMLKGIYLYNDKNSTAKVSILYGETTPGYSLPKEDYSLKAEDYDSMGKGAGQPGEHDYFDASMDINGYLIDFVAKKYASLATGDIVTIYYLFNEADGKKETLTTSFKKEAYGWDKTELNSFIASYYYTLIADDYKEMGNGTNEPGEKNYFTSAMNIDGYLGSFLRMQYPYAIAEKTAVVVYNYLEKGAVITKTSVYEFDGTNWNSYDPYASVMTVTTKIADMKYDGSNWSLNLLIGGSVEVTIKKDELLYLVEWVKNNKYAYWVDDLNEFYYGSAAKWGEVNNNYTNWKANDPNNEYASLSDDQLQALMDKRISEGFASHVLPALYSDPNPELSYDVSYNVYRGNRAGWNIVSFMYDKDKKVFYEIAAPAKKR
ncbi:hypothetical protein LJC54_08610 [Parabacteroides sp. OttesenSCG-928-J18]|nr:hypothetical protein [Parabacteroides sp. OttesenSCG-928-J18]